MQNKSRSGTLMQIEKRQRKVIRLPGLPVPNSRTLSERTLSADGKTGGETCGKSQIRETGFHPAFPPRLPAVYS